MNGIAISTKILKGMETSSSVGMFVRDTGGCLIPKLAISRSKEETKEIAFTETAESALFYFSAPAAVKLTNNYFKNKYQTGSRLMSMPIENINSISQEKLKNIKLAKFGKIASVFSIVLPLVYAIAPVRNYMTLNKSGKKEFTEVVGLKEKIKEEKKGEDKAKSLIKKLILAALGGLTLTSGILTAAKNDNFYKKIEPALTSIVKHFDFTKTNDLKLSHYGAFIYPVSIASYFYASRDKYERKENARRFSVTVPLLFFGERLIEKPIYKGFDKLFNTQVMQNGIVKSYDEILKLPEKLQKQYLKSKNFSYASTFLMNTIAIGAAVALLNRIATKKQYERENINNSQNN